MYPECAGSASTNNYFAVATADTTTTTNPSYSTDLTASNTRAVVAATSTLPTQSATNGIPHSSSPASIISPGNATTPASSILASTAAFSPAGGMSASTGAIIGGVIGGIALVCISVLVGILVLRHHRAPEAPPLGAMPSTIGNWTKSKFFSPESFSQHTGVGELPCYPGRTGHEAVELPSYSLRSDNQAVELPAWNR